MITVIGRGHSGTRALARTLIASGVFMGYQMNESHDLMPYQPMYEACRVLAKRVHWLGGLEWDWSDLHEGPIDVQFAQLVGRFLDQLGHTNAERRGWKLPETVMVLPWMVRLFPDVQYIYLVRDPRDCTLKSHRMTDDLGTLGIDYPHTDDVMRRRAISWYYQDKIVQITPKPEQWIEVRFEDFVLKQDETLERLSEFLGFELARIPVNKDAVGRWKRQVGVQTFDFLKPALERYGYELE